MWLENSADWNMVWREHDTYTFFWKRKLALLFLFNTIILIYKKILRNSYIIIKELVFQPNSFFVLQPLFLLIVFELFELITIYLNYINYHIVNKIRILNYLLQHKLTRLIVQEYYNHIFGLSLFFVIII